MASTAPLETETKTPETASVVGFGPDFKASLEIYPHVKYSSFENDDHKDTVAKLPELRFTKAIALEKIHGSHLCIEVVLVKGTPVLRVNRRKAIIGSAEELNKFFHCDRVIARHLKAIMTLFQEMHSADPTICRVQLHGEYYGGLYKNAEGKLYAEPEAMYPQSEIYYSPENHFIAYDIKSFHGDDQVQAWHGYQEVMDLCEKVGIPVLKPAATGTFEELMKLDSVFQTQIPVLHGLPSLKDNVAEGYVIRSLDGPGEKRVYRVKKKAPQFREKTKTKTKSAKLPKKKLELDEEGQAHLDAILKYLTRMRIAGKVTSVPPKFWLPTPGNASRITGIVAGDMLKDYQSEGTKLTFNSKDHRRALTTAIHEAVKPAVLAFLEEQCQILRDLGKSDFMKLTETEMTSLKEEMIKPKTEDTAEDTVDTTDKVDDLAAVGSA